MTLWSASAIAGYQLTEKSGWYYNDAAGGDDDRFYRVAVGDVIQGNATQEIIAVGIQSGASGSDGHLVVFSGDGSWTVLAELEKDFHGGDDGFYNLVVTDIDADNQQEMVVVGYATQDGEQENVIVGILAVQGDSIVLEGTWHEKDFGGRRNFGRAIAAGELDGESGLELAVAASEAQLPYTRYQVGVLSVEQGAWTEYWVEDDPTGVNDYARAVAIADLDNESGNEIVIAGTYGEAWSSILVAAYSFDGSTVSRKGNYYTIREGAQNNHGIDLAVGNVDDDPQLETVVVGNFDDGSINQDGGDFAAIVLAYDGTNFTSEAMLHLDLGESACPPPGPDSYNHPGWDQTTGVSIGDVDGDNAIEIVVSGQATRIQDGPCQWYDGFSGVLKKEGTDLILESEWYWKDFTDQTGSSQFDYLHDVLVADLENDGSPEIVGVGFSGPDFSPLTADQVAIVLTALDADDDPPNKPILTSPLDTAIDISLTPTLQTGDFSDPNSRDKHIKTEWQLSKESNFSSFIIDTTSLSHLTILTVPTLLLVEGLSYYWRVRFYDNYNTPSEWSDVYSFTTLTTTNDFNSNGIPDGQENMTVDMDNDGTADIDQTDIIKSLNTVVGDGQMGISRRDEPKIIAIESIESIDPDTISEIGRPDTMDLGLFAIRLTVANPGDSVEVPVYFSKAAPDNARWYMYDSIHGWVDYSEKGLAMFSTDRKLVLLTLKDGGNGDADGIANGVIVDPGGFGFASWIKGFVSNFGTTEGITTGQLTILDLILKTTLGGYYLSPIIPGTYLLSVSASGYGSESVSDIAIGEGDIVTQNFVLYPIGDINNDGYPNLADVILALQLLAKIQGPSNIDKDVDVNGDAKIGLEEVIYILQSISEMR